MRFFPLSGYARGAFLLMGYPLDALLPIQAWAWWTDGFWIGPRHTNYGNASVCAYELTDSTWSRGRDLVALLDLISTWIVRHIHLLELGRWPGGQALHTSYERLTEIRAGERCGCELPLLYDDCHRSGDAARPERDVVLEFTTKFPVPWRRPPRTRAECEEILTHTAARHETQLLPGARILDDPRHQWSNINAEVLRQFRSWRDGLLRATTKHK
jgi:hypothetical protein